MRILPEILSGLEGIYDMNENRKFRVRYIIMAGFAAVFIICISVIHFAFRASTVSVEGNEICTEEQIKDIVAGSGYFIKSIHTA